MRMPFAARRAGTWALCAALLLLAGCASLPPGAGYPKFPSAAVGAPRLTTLGRTFDTAARAHPGRSGFRLLNAGSDGFLVRAQLIDAAEVSLDLEYFIFRQDASGRLLTAAVLRAADRGVRVRVLVDDGDTMDGDERLFALGAHPNIEIRVFNPFAYRGHLFAMRAFEFVLDSQRLDYRMHNKLMVVDNAVALVGGRNIANAYFQVDPDAQFGDDDVLAAGPIVPRLSTTFDLFWNASLSIPARALGPDAPTGAGLADLRKDLATPRASLDIGDAFRAKLASREPLAGIVGGKDPLVWASAELVYDSPDKKRVEEGEAPGHLMEPVVAKVAAETRGELIVVTPYLVPGASGMRLLAGLRARGVRVRILTNSLEATTETEAHAGYMHYRRPMLEDGVELFEVRASLGSARGSGESRAKARETSYALHAKLFVFDRRKLYVGSMNFDERSHHINTEIGLIIDSPELARQAAARFEAITVPQDSYRVTLDTDATGGLAHLAWHTEESGRPVTYTIEPARSAWQRMQVELLTMLPLDHEL
jgi:putative cardiolipin synthase